MSRRHHAIDVQISVRIQQPRNGRPLTKDVVREAIIYRAEHGHDAPGFTCRIIQWRGKGQFLSALDEDHAWQRFANFIGLSAFDIDLPNQRVRVRSRMRSIAATEW